MKKEPTQLSNYFHFRDGKFEEKSLNVVAEHSVSLSVNGKTWLTYMCTPTDLEALAIGFLFNEGIIDSVKEVELIEVRPNLNLIDVWLTKNIITPTDWRRTSGCNGGFTAVSLAQKDKFLALPKNQYSGSWIIEFQKKLFDLQEIYHEVRGIHAAALSDGVSLGVNAEDIGRHNAVDKVIGKSLLAKTDLDKKILFVTGRVSSEMVLKAARFGCELIVSRTSPTSMSIEIAKELGVTLIGYARGREFNIYAHPARITA